MVSGWRKVFCTSIPHEPDPTAIEELEKQEDHNFDNGSRTPCIRAGFFFSSPSTPRLRCRTTAAPSPISPEISDSPRTLNTLTPCSPSSFSFLKSRLCLRTRRCGICLHSVKKGNGTASFTAECSHTFHFSCISDYVKTQGSLGCPVCTILWKEMPLLTVDDHRQCADVTRREKLASRFMDDVDLNDYLKLQRKRPELKVYNDDEPLTGFTPKARFNPLPEVGENYDENFRVGEVEVRLSPEAAVLAASGRHQTYGIILSVKAPEKFHRRAPIDLVAVVDVGGKMSRENLQIMKKAMRTLVSSLSSSDRLSIVAFSSHSKRLLPLRRMNDAGRRAVRCMVEAMAVLEGSSNSNDAVKKAVKVLLDRREKNPLAAVILLSDDLNLTHSHSPLNIPLHALNLTGTEEHVFVKLIKTILNVAVQDLRLELRFISGSTPPVITAVYSRTQKPNILGSSTIEIGELSTDEEREFLVELELPLSAVLSHQVLSVQCSYTEVLSQNMIYGQEQSLTVAHSTTVGSTSPTIQRLRDIFISTRALAESRRLAENNDLVELSRLQPRHKVEAHAQQSVAYTYMDEKGEPLTPTSAWRVADKLAKAAMVRKSVNRVSDLHGLEDARF